MKRILVVTVNWLGDSLMTTPAFAAIKNKYPGSYLAVMAPERVKAVFSNNPAVDKVIIFDEKGSQKGLIAKLKFICNLRKQQFDTVFLIHRSLTKALICWLAGIKKRISYRRAKNLIVVNVRVIPPQASQAGLHRQDYYLNLFEDQGIMVKQRITGFFIPDKVQQQVNISLQAVKHKHKIIVGINPSANWELKRWPTENFARLADWLIEQYQAAVVLIGKKSQQNIINQVTAKMKLEAYDFCGKTTLKELGALIKNSSLFVSNDSGPAHLAAALNIPTVVLFGPTDPKLTAPRGKKVKIVQKYTDCKIPCYQTQCLDNDCMRKITVEEVSAAIETQIKNG